MSTNTLTTWLPTGLASFNRAETLRRTVDPEATPFKSKYEAIEIYQQLINDLESFSTTDTPSHRLWLLILTLHSETAFTHMDTEDLASAERSLQSAIDILRNRLQFRCLVESFSSTDEDSGVVEGDEADAKEAAPPTMALLLIQLYNQLGFLKSMKLNFAASVPYLKEAERVFYSWEKTETAPLTLKDLLKLPPTSFSLTELEAHLSPLEDSSKSDISKANTMTLYYLAQAYQQTGEYTESARYCHQTLRQQHRWLGTGELNVDHIEWALNAATLSQYFSANEQYPVARHLMACARHVLGQIGEAQRLAEEERWKKAAADLDRIEVKYCLMILDESYRLMATDSLKDVPVSEWKFTPFLLNDPAIESAEALLPTFPVRDYTQAKAVVKYSLAAIESAKRFFSLDERATDYVDCTFDHSSIFGSTVPYEPEIENRCKMIKRRIDLLEGLAGQLNPQYFLQHCRKIHFELGDIYSQQVGLKYAAHEANFAKQQALLAAGTSTEALDKAEIDRNVAAMRKINQLVVKSITHYYKFLSSFEALNTKEKNPATKLASTLSFDRITVFELPGRIDDTKGELAGYLQPLVTSYLSIGRLYIKIVTSTPADRVRYWMICEKWYKELKTYLEKNEDQRREHFEEYWTQMEEMLALIPGKIQQIISQSVC